MLNKQWLMSGVCGLLLFMAAGSHAATPQGYVHEVSGDVQAAVGTAKPVPVAKNQNLDNNTTITTGPKSSVVLKFIDGTVIALNENTSFQIQKYEYNEKSPSTMSALFSMVRGGLRALTGAISSRNREGFRLTTSTATIGIRGTEFMAQLVNPLYLQVTAGTISVNNAAGVSLVMAGQTATVASSTSLATIGAIPPGTFGPLPNMTLPAPVPGPVPVPTAAGAGSAAASSAAAGGISGVAVGVAAAVAAGAVAVSGGSNTSGTTGTTGTK